MESAAGSSAPRPTKMREGDTLHHTARLAADVLLWHQKQPAGNVPCQDLVPRRKTRERGCGVGSWLEEKQTSLLLRPSLLAWFPMALHVCCRLSGSQQL